MYPCVSSVKGCERECKRLCICVCACYSLQMGVPWLSWSQTGSWKLHSQWLWHHKVCPVLHMHASEYMATSIALEFDTEVLNSWRGVVTSLTLFATLLCWIVYTEVHTCILLLLTMICWCFSVLSAYQPCTSAAMIAWSSYATVTTRPSQTSADWYVLCTHTHQGPCTCVNEAFWHCPTVGIKCVVLKCAWMRVCLGCSSERSPVYFTIVAVEVKVKMDFVMMTVKAACCGAVCLLTSSILSKCSWEWWCNEVKYDNWCVCVCVCVCVSDGG